MNKYAEPYTEPEEFPSWEKRINSKKKKKNPNNSSADIVRKSFNESGGKKVPFSNPSNIDFIMAGKTDRPGSQYKSGGLRRNSSRKEITKILSSNYLKPAAGNAPKMTSPSSKILDKNYITTLIKTTINQNTNRRAFSNTKFKNTSSESMMKADKSKDKFFSHVEQIRGTHNKILLEADNENKSAKLLSSVKRRIMKKTDTMKKSGSYKGSFGHNGILAERDSRDRDQGLISSIHDDLLKKIMTRPPSSLLKYY